MPLHGPCSGQRGFWSESTITVQVAKLNKALESSSVQVGDVLRGVTCTNFVYEVRMLHQHAHLFSFYKDALPYVSPIVQLRCLGRLGLPVCRPGNFVPRVVCTYFTAL